MGNAAAALEGPCCSSREKDATEMREKRQSPQFKVGANSDIPGVVEPPSGRYECFFTEDGEEKRALYVLKFRNDGSLAGQVVDEADGNTDGAENIKGAYNLRDMKVAWGEVFEDTSSPGGRYEVEVAADMTLESGKNATFAGTYKASDGAAGACRFISKGTVAKS
eukprot:TRINITY_DN8386_c0_g1_i1.p1 TRINITY_DN8386_c0_g1~~TRINITY_DN8386_c0_g1_i1.p1  ORF type:complete len:165 (+),score=39.86 TRINITY_DN8386_c0_g1_i1:92-586(+)